MALNKLRKLEQARRRYKADDAASIDPCNVVASQCADCPWREDGGILGNDVESRSALKLQVISQNNQFCHAPGLVGKPETQFCRGARDYQLQVFYRLGVLESPTDQAWANALGRSQ